MPRSTSSDDRPAGLDLPLAIRSGFALETSLRAEVRDRIARQLGRFLRHVERTSVRFEDVNGPRGGIDSACRIEIVLRERPSVVVEARAADARLAFGRAAESAARAVRRTLGRLGKSARRGARPTAEAPPSDRTGGATPRGDDDGSLIGRRVGRSQANLEQALARPEKGRRDVWVDTAAPGTSASDRRVGHGATATRNTKRNTAGMAATLEDSRTTPSRKSTRKSKNRAKAATLLERKAQVGLQSPAARASRAGAGRGHRR